MVFSEEQKPSEGQRDRVYGAKNGLTCSVGQHEWTSFTNKTDDNMLIVESWSTQAACPSVRPVSLLVGHPVFALCLLVRLTGEPFDGRPALCIQT